jgi:hypothetical protein
MRRSDELYRLGVVVKRLFSVIASIPDSAYGMAGVDSSFAACDARRTTSST